jgi:flagellar motor switch/type III secretory pathway protein FliN
MSPTPAAAFFGLEFPVEVWLAAENVPLARLASLRPGGVLPLAKDPDGPVELVVNGEPIASGELVVVDGRFAFRVTVTAQQKLARIDASPEGGPPR